MKFSVVVCTYNYGHLLPDALRSLRAQTSKDFELLVVDDGSTDNTESVVRHFAPQFFNCRYLKKPHTGISDSRNIGVQEATGTHIAFLDADDLWSPEYLEVFRSAFENDPHVEFACCDGFSIRASGQVTGTFFPKNLFPVCGPVTTSRDLFSLFCHAGPPTMTFLKSTFERIGPFDARLGYGEDWDWMIRAVLNQTYCLRLDRKLVLCRSHGGNLTKRVDKIFEAWLAVYARTLKNSGIDSEVEARARRLTRIRGIKLLAFCKANRARWALRQALQVFEGDPILRAAYGSTFFGSTVLLRFTKAIKNALAQLDRRHPKIDLSASPELIFKSLSNLSR